MFKATGGVFGEMDRTALVYIGVETSDDPVDSDPTSSHDGGGDA